MRESKQKALFLCECCETWVVRFPLEYPRMRMLHSGISQCVTSLYCSEDCALYAATERALLRSEEEEQDALQARTWTVG